MIHGNGQAETVCSEESLQGPPHSSLSLGIFLPVSLLELGEIGVPLILL